MNKIYKVVWNKARNCYVVASEFAKNHQTGTKRVKSTAAAVGMAACLLTSGVVAFATTGGPTVDTDNNYVWSNGGTGTGAQDNVVVGPGSKVNDSKKSIAVGKNATTQDKAEDAIAIGTDATASGTSTVAIGTGASAANANSSAYGHNAKASNGSTAIGANADAANSVVGTIVISADDGTKNHPNASSTGNRGITIGVGGASNGHDSIAIGTDANANGALNVAIGFGAKINNDSYNGAVALGAYSEVSDMKLGDKSNSEGYRPGIASSSYDPIWSNATIWDDTQQKLVYKKDDQLANSVWHATNGAVSVGRLDLNDPSKTITRQITNVAAGTWLTDAVNVAQLKALEAKMTETGNIKSDLHLINGTETISGDEGQSNAIKGYKVDENGKLTLKVEDVTGTEEGYDVNIDLSALKNSGGWTAQANGKDVIPKDGKINFKNGNNISVTNNEGEITIAATGLADINLSNITNEGKTTITNLAKAADIHVQEGSYAVDENGNVTMKYVDGNGNLIEGKSLTITGLTSTNANNAAVVYVDNDKTQSLHSTNSGNIGTGSIALGKKANAVDNSIAIGDGASVVEGSNGQGGVALGKQAYAGYKGISLGNSAVSGREGVIAIGDSVNSQGLYSTVAGTGSKITTDGTLYTVKLPFLGEKSVDVQGAIATSYGAYNTIENNNKKVFSGVANSVMGSVNTVTNSNGITIQGTGNKVTNAYKDMNITPSDLLKFQTGDYSALAQKDSGAVAVIGGANTISDQTSSTVIGFGNTVAGTNSTGVFTAGSHNKLTHVSNSLIMGNNNTLENRTNVISLGNENTIKADNAVAIGNGTVVSVDDSVAIGKNSVADRVVKEGAVGAFAPDTIKDTEKSIWTATAGTVSVGDANKGLTRQITNVAAGSEDTDAVNVAQLKKVQETITSDVSNKTFGLTDDSGKAEVTNTLNNTVQVKGANGITSTVKDGALEIGLGNALTVGKDGKDGAAGSIGLVGPAGKDGKDGLTTTVIKTEYGSAGVDGKDGITRIIYETKDGVKHEVATLDDGLKFQGDRGDVIAKKLNETLNIKGNAAATAELSDGNIGVINENGDLVVKLNKDLTGLNSVNTNNAYVTKVDENNNNSVTNVQYVKNQIANSSWNLVAGTGTSTAIKPTNTVTFDTANGVTISKEETKDEKGNVIGAKVTVGLGDTVQVGDIAIGKQVGGGANTTNGKYITGLDNKAWDKDNIASGRAATEDQLQAVQKSITTDIGNKTFGLADDNGNKVTKKLGDTVQVKGTHGITSTVKDGALEIGLGNALTVGKDGKDGAAGSIGLVGPAGKDGKDGLTTTVIKTEYGSAGVDGKDGITRIIYETKDGVKHEVATLDDGLKFQGDRGDVIAKKLNETLNIKGNAAATAKLSDGNIGITNENGDLVVKLNKDLKDLNSVTTGDTMMNTNGLTIGSGTTGLEFSKNRVSVGGQQIHDVQAGTDDMDAVNVSQLKKQTATSKTTVSDGTNTTVTSTVAEDGHTDYKVNLNKELEGIESISNGDNKINLNDNGIVISKGNDKVFSITDAGMGMSVIGDDYVTRSIMVSKNGTVISGGLSVAGSKITNVAVGTEDTDAVNYGQLKQAVSEGNTDTHIKAGEYSVGQDNTVSMDVVDKNGKSTGEKVTIKDVAKASDVGDVSKIADDIKNKDGKTTTVVDAVNNVNNKVGDLNYSKVEKGDINDGDNTTTAIGKLNQKLSDVEQTAGKHSSVSTDDSNLKITEGTNDAGGKDYNVSLNKDLTLDSVTIGDTKMDTNGITVGDKVSLTKDGLTAGDTKITSDGLSIGDKTYVSKDGLNANNQTITNVADGKVEKGSTDAVNGGQLYETNQAVINNSNNISSLSHSLSNLDNRVNKVGAGAAALAALHPLDFDPDAKWDFAAGYGNYRGTNAAAVGAYYRPNEDTMFSVGGTFGNGENMVNAGVSFKLGAGSSHVSTSRVAMAKEIKELRSELEAMKSAVLDANAGKKVDTSKLQLFPDVPQNHWAYEYVAQLAGNGMIEGYPDGNFAGDRPMTRYEFAAILYRAMTKGAVLSDKILSEFSHELEYFTVDTVAKDKAGNPTIQRVRTVKANKNK